MTLATGSSLSHYAILAPIGSGAMGEVYRARDTRLGREVAIKVLPEHFADDEERLARFEREARTLAALNHPNVAQIFGVDQVDETCFLVLELVPGESLEERLRRGPLPLEEALDVCRQIAAGLEAAHEAGVIHRDLKPANVRLTPDGKIKLLDFGLAKPMPLAGETRSTDSVLSTEAGRLLGTPTYMAPEQARGKPIDRRVDVWAFGCVLYECLSGRRAFDGESLSDVLAAVLHSEPEWKRLPPRTPERVRELLADCLVKDPRVRARDSGEVRRQLERAHLAPAGHASTSGGHGRERLAWTAAGLGALVAVYLALRPAPPMAAAAVVRSSLLLPEGFVLADTDRPLCLAPDGRRLALVGAPFGETPLLWIRGLDGTVLQPLTGSERAEYPFWSPDGRDLAFFADGKLKRMPASGGTVATLCASESSRGGSWGSRGDIVFAPAAFGPLLRVPAGGGTPTPISSPDGRESDRLPHFLPDGRRLLFTRTNSEAEGIYALDLDSGEQRLVLREPSDARYVSPGHLVFVRGQDLVSQAFDADALELEDEPRLLVETVEFNAYRFTGAYSVSASGELVYTVPTIRRQLQWFDAEGRAGERLGSPARFAEVGLSPDGRRVAATIGYVGEVSELWILDAQRGLGTRLVQGLSTGGTRVWFPDPDTIAYARRETTAEREFVASLHALDGSAPPREFPGGWGTDVSPDGRWMLYGQQNPGTSFDLRCRAMEGDGEVVVVAASTASEQDGRFAPDGRWIVYVSDVSGRDELYLRPFPGPGDSLQLTSQGVDGSGLVAWLADGRVVYREAADPRKLWALAVDTSGPAPGIGEPMPLCNGREIADGPCTIDAGGARVLVAVPADSGAQRAVNLVQNGLTAVPEVAR
jgi:Tol biopolymer transport system component/tRNA A-37 threonylcarbamoyl transferase component Bud32